MSRRSLSRVYREQRKSLGCEPVAPQKGSAFPMAHTQSGLWVSWHLLDLDNGASSVPVRQALGLVLPAALKSFYETADPGLVVETTLRRGYTVTEINSTVAPIEVASQLATVMAVEYFSVERTIAEPAQQIA